MNLQEAVERVLQGEPMHMLAAAYRDEMIADMGLEEDDVSETTFRPETGKFMNQLCRHLGERYEGDHRVCSSLEDWVHKVDDYEAYDALLSAFSFEGKATVLRKGRILFPGPLTAHWES